MTIPRMAELVTQILKSRVYIDFARAFGHTTGLAVHLVPVQNSELPPFERQQHFCRILARQPACAKMCTAVDCTLQANAQGCSRTQTCFAGFCETAVPVRLGKVTFALLRIGEISLMPVTPRTLAGVKQRLGEQFRDLFDARLEKAYLSTPVMAWRDYEEIVRLLTVFSTYLTEFSSELQEFSEPKLETEPKEITRARRYVEEHFKEPICLKQVALTLNLSDNYFCRHFRKVTGSTFTDFVTHVRLEKARGLLLNPNHRISEVAFEVGFQSLSQFNRSFRKHFGCSPRDIRRLKNTSSERRKIRTVVAGALKKPGGGAAILTKTRS